MIVVIDNFDSFTYNLVQLLGELGCDSKVFRNNCISVDEIQKLSPSHIIISPGPGTPADAGISIECILKLGPIIPTLGVCLGHQCISQAFRGIVASATSLMHGKTSLVFHHGNSLFWGIASPFVAMRYHSLIVYEPLPPSLELLATTLDDEVMAIGHQIYPIYGVQFHPESILTPDGKKILANFLHL